MVEQGGYPEIPFKPHEVEREKRLKALGRKFQELMDEQGNDTALKGGTALRFKLGLPRPSTDLDFEGNEWPSSKAGSNLHLGVDAERRVSPAFQTREATAAADQRVLGTARVSW